MSIFSKLPISITFGRQSKLNEEMLTMYLSSSPTFDISKAESISPVYTCVKILSDTLGRLPLGVYQYEPTRGRLKDKEHYLYDIVHYNPNDYTTSQVFFSALEAIRNLKGNSFAYIHRDSGSGTVLRLELLTPERVDGYNIVNGQLFYKIYFGEGEERELRTISSNDVLHFRGLTKNGIWGLNPIEALRLNLSTTFQGMTTADSFFKNSAMSPQAIRSTVAGANQKAMLEALESFQKKYGGSSQAGKIIPLPPNTELQSLSMNLADAEFISMVKFNADQISSLFGVPSFMVGNTEASKYSNIEQTMINFKVNTAAPITRMYRQEMEYKLLTTKERRDNKSIEFNLMALVETDHRTRLEGYRILSNIGAITPNKIAVLEGLETYEGGDDHYIQTNMMSVEEYKKKKTDTNIKN